MIIAIPTNNIDFKSEVPKRAQNAAYCKYVSDAGYNPILIPMEADPNVVASIADGLLLAGGIDIDPIYYGFSNYASFGVDPAKDDAERRLFYAFKAEHKPIMGICRGFQLIFREFLHTHEEYEDYLDYDEHIEKHSQTTALNSRRNVPTHLVRAVKTSLYNVPLEEEEETALVPVNSMHHQIATINYVGVAGDFSDNDDDIPTKEPSILRFDDFELTAWSLRGVTRPQLSKGKPDFEGYWAIIEAMKIHNWGSPIMGVQWHPEELRDIALIRNFFSVNNVNVQELAQEAG